MSTHDNEAGGFDTDDWDRFTPFTGRAASLDDVDAKRAVFALGDTEDARPLDMALPQPAIWWDDEADGTGQAAVIVQAEAHRIEGDEGPEMMEVVGLILADGGAAVALLEDVDLVEPSDPTWRGLVESAVEGDDD